MGRPRASKLKKTKDSPVFTLFNYLPWELRHMIWEEALPDPAPQVLIYEPTTFSKWDPESNTWDANNGTPRVPIPPPALLHTTQESRAFALKHVRVREVEGAPTQFWAPRVYARIRSRVHHRIVSRAFNRDIDALFIDDSYFDDFVKMYKSQKPEAPRHLIFSSTYFNHRLRETPSYGHTWQDFMSVADVSSRGLRSVSLTWKSSEHDHLETEALSNQELSAYYHAEPNVDLVSWEIDIFKRIASEFGSLHVPDGVPWKFRVGSGGLPVLIADGGEDKERVLEFPYVSIRRFNASSRDQNWLSWSSNISYIILGT